MEISTEIHLIGYDHKNQCYTIDHTFIEDRTVFGKEFNLSFDEFRNEMEGYSKEWVDNLTLKELIDNFAFYDEEEANERLNKIMAEEKASWEEKAKNERAD